MPIAEADIFGPSWRDIVHGLSKAPVHWWQSQREALCKIAAAGSPAYVYHLPSVRKQADALCGITSLERRFYAIKANAHPAILRELETRGFGFECVSAAELRHVKAVFPELPAERVLFTPSFASRAEYAEARTLAEWITVDSLYPLQHWPELFAGRKLVLRIDPGYGLGHHAHVRTGGEDAKFGLALADLPAFRAAAAQIKTEIAVLHAHVGSGVTDCRHWAQLFAQLAQLAEDIGSVKAINVGGGLAVPYSDTETEFDLPALAATLAEHAAQWPQYAIWLEPGRYLVAQAGVLLATVTQVVDKLGIRRVGLDAGMNALMRPALYQAKHRMRNLSRAPDAPTQRVDVVGPICESTDVLAHAIPLPVATAEGDVVLIDTAGAYGYVMANQYNQRALPREVILDV
jgi:diaminopimelate decarboxylase/aspartate kinase